MVGWHHWFNGHEFEQTPGNGEGQGSLACCSPRGHKESDTTLQLNNNNMSTESMMPSNHLILCWPLLLLPLIFPKRRVFSNESALCIRWPKNWSFSISPSNEIQGWFPSGLTGLISLLSKRGSRVFSSTIVWKHQFFSAQPFLWSNSDIHTWLLEKP